jgi:putative MATE family efflux protein
MLRKYIGDRAFYLRVIAVALPIIIQNGIANFVSLLDNIMVGQVGQIPMSGVAIVNQLMFVFNLCVFGATSGAGIFTAQFHGSGDAVGVRHTFRFKLIIGVLISTLGVAIFLAAGDPLIGLYLTGEGDQADAAGILHYGREYLLVMLWGLPAFAISNSYASTLRESGETMVPMAASITAVFVNLILNWVLIFGNLGAPQLGVVGAAFATVIARYVELIVVVIWTHMHGEKMPFIIGAFRSLHIPGKLLKRIIIKGMPLLVNEALWSTGMAMMNQCYSTRGLDVVPAQQISSTIYNLGSVVFLAMGNAVGILIGQMLGSGESEERVRDTDRKLIFASVVSCIFFGGLMAATAPFFPRIYDATHSVQTLATQLILISAIFLPFNGYTNAAYFTLRSGGQTMVTFLFDSFFVWVFCVPLAFVLSRFTTLPILPLYFICCGTDLVKSAIGAVMIKQGKWIQNLTVK